MSVTTQDLLERAEERTGLARNQLLLMVAKSAAVRHIAQGAHSEQFVLKGGTLLTHVYNSPRQSIQDVDYLHRQPETVTAPELEQALFGEAQGIVFEPAFSYQAAREQFRGTVEFTFDDIVIRRSRPLKVSVSVRPGEWLDISKSSLETSGSCVGWVLHTHSARGRICGRPGRLSLRPHTLKPVYFGFRRIALITERLQVRGRPFSSLRLGIGGGKRSGLRLSFSQISPSPRRRTQ